MKIYIQCHTSDLLNVVSHSLKGCLLHCVTVTSLSAQNIQLWLHVFIRPGSSFLFTYPDYCLFLGSTFWELERGLAQLWFASLGASSQLLVADRCVLQFEKFIFTSLEWGQRCCLIWQSVTCSCHASISVSESQLAKTLH